MATSAADIQKLYIAYFNRPADTAGLAFWQARADAKGGIQAVASEFATAKEYTDLYDGVSSYDIVNSLYINLFGRSAEDAGLKYWANKLQTGELTIGTVALTIASSAQGNDLKTVTNKISAADQFTSTLTVDQILGYSGESPNAVAKAWLSTVGSTPASLTAALTTLDTAQETAAAARGLTFDLATDTVFAGANYNDTYTGVIADLVTVAGKTLDGGFGVDSLNLSAVGDGTALTGVTIKNIEKINLTGAAAATIDANFFGGSTEIAVDGVDTAVTNVGSQAIAFTGGAAIDNTVTYKTAVTAASIKLVDSDGTVTLTGTNLATATVTGTSSGNLTLVDTNQKIKTLNVGLAGEATVLDLADLVGLTKIEASASRADLAIDATLLTKLTALTTGSGDDVVTIDKVFAAGNTGTALTVSTGDGADTINVKVAGIAAASGGTAAVTGTVTINGGAGDDRFVVAATADLPTGTTLVGGEGTDTVAIAQTAFTAAQYTALTNATSGIEVAEFGAAVVDGSYLTEFATLSFTADGAVVTNASEAITTVGSISVSGIGYVAGSGAIASTYGSGAVDVSITETAKIVTVNANTAVVHVSSETSNIATTVTGDVQTSLTVNVNSTNDGETTPTVYTASANVVVDETHNTALKAVTLAGDGTVTLDNEDGVALVTVDASKLGGLALNGNVVGGLTYWGSAELAETITLGSGHDQIIVRSTYANMDTITGFDAVQESASAGKSTVDVLYFGGQTIDGAFAGQVSKMALAPSDLTLDLALAHAASASSVEQAAGNSGIVSFVFAGNTYVFQDVVVTGEVAGTLGDTDLVVKLTGSIDLSTKFAVHA